MEKPVILYVDDEPSALESIKMGLEEKGYTILTAESGSKALEILKTHTPDLIMTDLRMQPMNGFEFFEEVRKIENFAETPLFFLTAVDDFLAQKYGQKLGVDAYITKPVDLNNLHNLIKGKLKGK